jgi:hypothetical protein
VPVDLRGLLLRRDQKLRVVDVVLRERDRRPEKRAVVPVHGLAGGLLVPAPRTIRDARRPGVAREPVSAAGDGEVGVLRRRVDDVPKHTISLARSIHQGPGEERHAAQTS